MSPDIRERMRNFDRNMADVPKIRVSSPDYPASPATWFMDPYTDPHGRFWVCLSDDELKDRRGWCMLPEYHRALQAEITYRRTRVNA